MARQPRLSLPGVMHLVQQRGHNGGAIVLDAQDSDQLLQALREAARLHGVALHAYAVTASELRLLATPDTAEGISRTMQALGRRHAAAFNRRHGRSGALWDGRFRSALIESGPAALLALRLVESAPAQAPAAAGPDAAAAAAGEGIERSSLPHRLGQRRDAALVDPPAYWQLGNTPFERESQYRRLLAEALTDADQAALRSALSRGWALGSAGFLQRLAQASRRPAQPRPRGRPRRGSAPA
ncbi:MAG: transposase [Proteobacteria bacterium]|nr:transposase [Pseudomonadota bacterium]